MQIPSHATRGASKSERVVIDPNTPAAAGPLLDTMESIEAFETTPCHARFPHTNSYALLMESAARFSDDAALEFLLTGKRDEPTQTLSFRELARRITQTANLLHSLGIRAADTVSILLPVLPQSHPVIWGCQAAGIANPINPMLEAEHIAEIIEAAGSKLIVCLAPSPHSDLWTKLSGILHRLANVHTVVFVQLAHFTTSDPDIQSALGVPVIDYDSAIELQPHDRLISGRKFAATDIAACFHTGGTTGRPKLAQLTHGNLAFLGQLMQVYTAHLPRHTILCGLPLFHIYGVIIQGIAAFSIGCRVVLLTPSGFRSQEGMKNFWHHIERFQVRGFSTVPTVLMALTQIPVGTADISCLQTINSGAAPLSPAFEHNFEKQFNVAVSNGYGMTETTSLISRAPTWQPPGSVGRRLPYSRIRIVHLRDDSVLRECRTGESGVILVKGPQVFLGYKDVQDNRHAWIEKEWFNTGDIGYLDADGFLFLSGRAKDLIIRGGHNIDPALLEDVLCRHPAVLSAVAVGMPDAYAGELPMAFVVLAPCSAATHEELLHWCEQHISERAAVPKRIEIIPAMPLTVVGKIYRPALRQHITQLLVRETLAEGGVSATVTCRQDHQRGLTVEVRTPDLASQDQARTLLAPFALHFEYR
jgi:fatty-acyl-CoA synthase